MRTIKAGKMTDITDFRNKIIYLFFLQKESNYATEEQSVFQNTLLRQPSVTSRTGVFMSHIHRNKTHGSKLSCKSLGFKDLATW